MPNRMTFMERMSGRLAAIESVLKKLEPVESLLERITLLENTIFTTKRVFTFQEACKYAVQAHIEQGDTALQTAR